MKDATLNVKRRTLLTAAACAPAIAVGLLLAQRQRMPVALPQEVLDIPASAGYHETEHIRKYYRSASIL